MPSADQSYILQYLQHNAEEDARLDTQHIYLKALTNNNQLLSPEILEVNGVPDAIADLGCGTGVFLNDCSRTYYHSAEVGVPCLVGFDVNEDRFVKKREPGVQFCTHDCTEPFAEKWLGKFDVVNIRMIWAALKQDDVILLIRNALSLLKPGGYLQWLECEFDNIKTTPPSDAFKETLACLDAERERRGLMTQIPSNMMQILLSLRDEGHPEIRSFQTVSTKRAPKYKAMGKEFIQGYNNQILQAMKIVLGGIIDRIEKSSEAQNGDDLARLKRHYNFFTEAMNEPGTLDIDTEVSLLLGRKAG